MSWQKRFTFRDKRSIKHEVSGREFRFYPNRMALLTEARDLSQPVARAINTLFVDQSRDASSTVKRQNEGNFYLEDITTDALSVEMAKHRMDERSGAIETIMGTLADSRSLLLLGKLFMDSLREEFPYDKRRSAQEVEEFLFGSDEEVDGEQSYTGLDLPVLVEMFKGWMKANALVFGEAGEQLVGLVKAKIEGLTTESDSVTTEPTNGEPSKIPSSQPSDMDSAESISTS